MTISRLLVALALTLAVMRSFPASAAEIVIIANPSVDADAPLTLDQIASIYLLRTTTWSDGSHIVPVNREISSSLRIRFNSRVLREDDATLAAYWNQMHFMGKLPPVVQESDQAMLAFIQNVPGSIGYISAGIAPVNVKVLARVP